MEFPSKKIKILCVIPSRLRSTRLPRKPLALIDGKAMVQWVYEAAVKCKDFTKVIVATDAIEIADIIRNVGGQIEMTPSELMTGSDRVAFVSKKYNDYDVVVNLQGDEPFVTPEMLSTLVEPFKNDSSVVMSTLASPFKYESDYNDPNTVKVIFDKNFDAIYFSRSPIPFFREGVREVPVAAHLGMYAYKREFLQKYTDFKQTELEKAELLEQLRVIENGYKIRVGFTDKRIVEINTPEELELAQAYAKSLKNI